MSIREALVGVFTDDPVNWAKWAVVFAILIGGYFIAIPLYKKVSHSVSLERKRDTFVGIVQCSPHYAFLVPTGKQMPYDIFIPVEELNGARNGVKAVVRQSSSKT